VLIELFEKHVHDEHKNRLVTLNDIKEVRYYDNEKLLEEIMSPKYTTFFKKGKFVTKLLTAEIKREIREVQSQFKVMSEQQIIQTKLKLTVENFNYELSIEANAAST
jgi:hypothetical protein